MGNEAKATPAAPAAKQQQAKPAVPAAKNSGGETSASRREDYLAKNADRFNAEYAEEADDELDTGLDGSTPSKKLESDQDDDSGTGTADDEADDSDIDDDDDSDTPDDDAEDEGSWEARFKDTQAKLTNTTKELASLKRERAKEASEHVRRGHEMEDRFGEVEGISRWYTDLAKQELTQLQQVNPQSLSQEQYAQWQQQVAAAQFRAQQFEQRWQDVKRRSDEARKQHLSRQVKSAREYLERTIDNFDEAYASISEYAQNRGVAPEVFKRITDPALIELIHESMVANATPDAIETVEKKTKARRHKSNALRARDEKGRFQQADKRFRSANTSVDRKRAYLEREQSRFDREYGRR